jgi:stearoyl-CoA desaturase (delta-9 desaturase)
MQSETNSVRSLVWENIIFFAVTTLIAVVGAPIYIYHYGISLSEWLLMAFFFAATGLGVTVGYHRLFAHRNFKASPLVRFLVLFFGAAAFEQSALKWASQHRDHHKYVDTDLDPYSIKKGFWYAHIGWLIFWQHKIHYENAKDLQESRLIMHQHKYYHFWAVAAGILMPLLIGALTGHALGALIFAVCVRLTFVYHATFCINSVCHMFGKATYDIYASARDHWFIALFTFGEGYHNFHHRFPADYRNGVCWYHWDPSKWLIALLARMGLVWDLKTMSKFRILEAKLAAENQTAQDFLKRMADHPQLALMHHRLSDQYQRLKDQLLAWEQAAKEYHGVLYERFTRRSAELRKGASEKMLAARRHFEDTRLQWKSLQLHLGIAFA